MSKHYFLNSNLTTAGIFAELTVSIQVNGVGVFKETILVTPKSLHAYDAM